ncbi:MAG: TetR/AcrR family transcriptional regulator [Filomicrobium sp.]
MTKQTKPRTSLAFRNKLRESILEIGKRLIEEEGLSSVQARRIAIEAGCAVGSIYNVFEDLDELIIELNRRTLDELEAKLQAAHDQPKQATTHGRLLALARAYFLYATNHKMPWRAIFEHQLPEGRTAPPEYREDQDRLFALVEECLANDITEKDQRKNAARALFASVHGIVSLSLDRKLGDFEPEATRRQIEFLIGCTAHGLHQACKEQC